MAVSYFVLWWMPFGPSDILTWQNITMATDSIILSILQAEYKTQIKKIVSIQRLTPQKKTMLIKKECSWKL